MEKIRVTKHDHLPVGDRFWMKVDRSVEGCWRWRAGTDGRGYGSFKMDGRSLPAHRVAWELVNGRVPDGCVLDHLCRNTLCVNPAHLEPVSNAENVRRGLKTYALRTTCKQGHDISHPGNVKTRLDGRRECRACARESYRRSPSALRRGKAA